MYFDKILNCKWNHASIQVYADHDHPHEPVVVVQTDHNFDCAYGVLSPEQARELGEMLFEAATTADGRT